MSKSSISSHDKNRLLVLIAVALCVLMALPAISSAAFINEFKTASAMGHISYLSKSIGLRLAGGNNERAAVLYVKRQLEQYGYMPTIQDVPLPNKQKSHNVIAFLPGKSAKTIIVGAHLDSKGGPGANDNASGIGTVLELARVLKYRSNRPYSIKFVFFGAEERIGANKNDHHFGSRHHVKKMGRYERSMTLEMVNVDMVGNGSSLCVRAFGKKPNLFNQNFMKFARLQGVGTVYRTAGDDSDFEAFERVGIKSVWLEYRYDSNWHTKRDTYERISSKNIYTTGMLLERYLVSRH